MGKRNMPPMQGQRRCKAYTVELPRNQKVENEIYKLEMVVYK
jgi:hypothetical protein